MQVDKALWKKAQLFAQSGVHNLQYKIPNTNDGFIFPNTKQLEKLQLLPSVAERRQQLHASVVVYKRVLRSPEQFEGSFSELISVYNDYYFMTPTASPTAYVKFDCSCPAFGKSGICKHSLGWAILKLFVAVPSHSDITRIHGNTRTCGSPRKITPAWNVE